MTEPTSLTIDGVIEDFRNADHEVPRESMQWALDNWDIAGPRSLELLSAHARGTERTEQTENAVVFISRLVAEKEETAAFGDLCRLLRDMNVAPFLAADAISSTLSQLLISTFDGNAATLREVVEDHTIDEFIRHAAITAVAYLTRIGRIPEADTREWLRHLLTAMQPRGECFVWVGWAQTVAMLGFADVAADAGPVFEQGFTGRSMGLGDFEAELKRALDDPESMALFVEKELGPFTGCIDELDEWYDMSGSGSWDDEDDDEAEKAASFASLAPQWTSSGGDRNPWRHVGRNDQCPCGSGKKFKKCCLGKPDAERPVLSTGRSV